MPEMKGLLLVLVAGILALPLRGDDATAPDGAADATTNGADATANGAADATENGAVEESPISTAESQDYPQVSCTSGDTIASAETLQMASDVRDQLGPLLGLGRAWRFSVHIRIMTPDDPLLAKVDREASAVFAEGTTMKIEAVLPSTDPNAREFIQRQFVTALLWEKFFAGTKSFDAHTHLDVVPLWLVEGLREWLNEDPEHNRERIVGRMVRTGCAPKLDDVTHWAVLSDDRLLGAWQRAFCYYLVDSLIAPGPKRDDFQAWLGSFARSDQASASLLLPTEKEWENQLVDAGQRGREIVYSWEETEAEVSASDNILVKSDKSSDTRICTFETVADFPYDQHLVDALQHKIFDLTNLELRAHVSWHPILEYYRAGLTALLDGKHKEEARLFLQQAEQARQAEIAYHQKLVDYMNWFEVTKDYSGNDTEFRSYFSTVQEMEKAQGDPAHPNPLRAEVLQVESQL
jgi:hypothetical protein